MKNLISVFVIFSMLMSLSLPAFSKDAKAEDKNEICVIYSAQADKEGDVVTFEGKTALKWGPGAEHLRGRNVGTLRLTPDMHMEKYRYIAVDIYSVKNTNNTFCISFYGDESPKDVEDPFYRASFCANWECEWKTIKIPITGGLYGRGDFGAGHSPAYAMTEARSIMMTANPYASTAFYPDTEVYISRIYFDGIANGTTTEKENGELILPDEYEPGKTTDYVALVKAKHPNKAHPRLIVTDELLDRIRTYKDTDPFMKKAYSLVVEKADMLLGQEPTAAYYLNKAGNAYQFNRTIETVAQYCGLMYLLTGDTKYADRIWAEVQNMASSDKLWCDTSTGLDSAHIANGMAIAYDWCYDYLDDSQRLIIRNAIMKHALSYGVKIRNGSGYMGFRNNVVAANSKGYMSACLAICDEPGYEYVCNEFINNVITYLPENLFFQFVPDGNYAEGSGYWEYTIKSLSFMFTAMNTAMGTDGGLSSYPGIKETSLWPFGMRGTQGDFNHSDAALDALQTGSPAYHYLADRYNLPSLRAYRLDTYEKYEGLSIEDLYWYNPDAKVQLDWREGLPKDYFYGGLEPVISMRSTYEPDAIFIAGKGGNRMTGHDQSDAGSYVLDALGIRWIEDTGAGVYNTDLPEKYYYRERAEGHNCLYFNPETGGGKAGGQTVATNNQDTLCPIIDEGSSNAAAFGVLDLQPSYQEDTTEYKRGIALVNNRTQVVIRDEFKGRRGSELYSYFHTGKSNEITINPDGKSLIMKTKNGEVCMVNFFTDIKDFEIGVMEAVPHSASPVPGPQNVQDRDASTQHKFYLHTDNVTNASITVVFTPMMGEKDYTLPEILPLSDWDKYLENPAPLTGISVDGIPLSEFDSGLGTYNFETDKVGTVTATAPEGVELSITQANALGETALINAVNKKTGSSYTYKVNFVSFVVPGIREGVAFENIDAHHIPEPQNPPEHIKDGDMTTRFAIDGYDGEAYFVTDLGSSHLLKGYSVSFYNGHKRKNKYKVEISEDKENWTTVFEGFSPGNTDQLLEYSFEPTWSRYVRFTGYGAYTGDETTQSSKWNSITEFVVHEEMVDFSDTSSHWAQADIFFSRKNSLVNGVGDNMFMPEKSVTRAEFITMMVRACNFSEVSYEEGAFSDVNSDDWFSKNVATAKDRGIIPPEMTNDGNFYPNKELTREEMCAIAVLAYSASARRDVISSDLTKMFKDVEAGPYSGYIDKAIGLRIVNGMSEDTFAPSANITRAQAATILKRLYLKIFNVNN